MSKAPAFQFYARDWLADSKVRRLRLDERGAYCDLLCVQWNEGAIPMDCEEAGMSIGIHPDTWPEWRSRIWPNVVTFFPDGMNHRLAGLSDERQALIQAKRKAGKKGGKTRARNAKQNQTVASTTSFLLQADPSSAVCSLQSATDNVAKATTRGVVDNSRNGTTATAQIEETWNAKLAPHCRRAGGEKHTGNWLSWCKRRMDEGVSVDALEARVGGLCELRDKGVFGEWIEKGVPMTPAIFERTPQLRQECDSAWIKYGPQDRATQDIVRGMTRI